MTGALKCGLDDPGDAGGSGRRWRIREALEDPGGAGGSGRRWRIREALEDPHRLVDHLRRMGRI